MYNKVTIIGTLTKEMTFSHKCTNENFYSNQISSVRSSGAADLIPIIVPEYTTNLAQFHEGDRVKVVGEIRTHNDNHKVKLFVFAEDIVITDAEDSNTVEIGGRLCKQAVLRKTPLGREITDILIAVTRRNSRTDYIPCVTWGRTARRTEQYHVGTWVEVLGRFQSREYTKGEEVRTAYEVSVISLDGGADG